MTRSFPQAAPSTGSAQTGNVVSLAAFRRKRQQPTVVATDFGSAWYHEAAIKTDHAAPTKIP